MELAEFLKQTQQEVSTEIDDRLGSPGNAYPYPESVFSEIVMQHMSEIGMTFEPVVCHYTAKVGNANLRLSGYAVSEDADQIDLFISLYEPGNEIKPVPDAETKSAAEQCLRFLGKCADGSLLSTMDKSNDAYALALNIRDSYPKLDQIRVYILTNRQAKSKNFKSREINGKTVKLEVMDIERLHRHWSEGKPRDELVVNFEEVSGGALPCVYVPSEAEGYDYAMTVIPGEALRFIYEKYGARLLEANVRSFLSVTGKVNKGIRDTLKNEPDRFMAYNNGIVLIADEANLGRTKDGSIGIIWLKGMQIVNGGQTTASLYFTQKKNPEVDLTLVRIPAKIIVLKSKNTENEEKLISNISKYANSQNSVKSSDLSANNPFHVEIEKLALSTYCPNGIGRWFYERAAGSYNVMLAREGKTPAKLRQLKDSIPPARKITKTDLAKYLNAWDQLPHLVSLGSQKNFDNFMSQFTDQASQNGLALLDITFFKKAIAKAILFKAVQKVIRPMFPAFQANITTYTISLIANRLKNKLDLDKVWQQQEISQQLKAQVQTWSVEVNRILLDSAGGKMVSEWAKKQECWETVRESKYPPLQSGIPELK